MMKLYGQIAVYLILGLYYLMLGKNGYLFSIPIINSKLISSEGRFDFNYGNGKIIVAYVIATNKKKKRYDGCIKAKYIPHQIPLPIVNMSGA